mmetsp:Transcript_29285/g.76771  ORF Transcript_29285/g.76771 Transcript_29285/m.76771 type:complete len:219 (+) Transcript_29285:1032-1688(+)
MERIVWTPWYLPPSKCSSCSSPFRRILPAEDTALCLGTLHLVVLRGSSLTSVAACSNAAPLIRPITAVAHTIVDQAGWNVQWGVRSISAVEVPARTRRSAGLIATARAVAVLVVHHRLRYPRCVVPAEDCGAHVTGGVGRGDAPREGAVLARLLCIRRDPRFRHDNQLGNGFAFIDHVHVAVTRPVVKGLSLDFKAKQLVRRELHHKEDRAHTQCQPH